MAGKIPNPTDKHIGSRVRMRRMMMRMSQGKLGEKLGLTFQQIQKYEKGTNAIAVSRLQQMSDILQVPITFFFEGAPNLPEHFGTKAAPSPAYMNEFCSCINGVRLARAFVKLTETNPAAGRKLVEMTEAFAGIKSTGEVIHLADSRARKKISSR